MMLISAVISQQCICECFFLNLPLPTIMIALLSTVNQLLQKSNSGDLGLSVMKEWKTDYFHMTSHLGVI